MAKPENFITRLRKAMDLLCRWNRHEYKSDRDVLHKLLEIFDPEFKAVWRMDE
jgi:hypothetical protein